MSAPKPANPARKTLRISGTYTLEPLAEVVDYWLRQFGDEAVVATGEYGQMYPELLDPSSPLRRNRDGANAIVLRWEDLAARLVAGGGARALAWSELEPQVTELAAALAAFDHVVPCLVIIGPSTPDRPEFARATSELVQRMAGTHNIFVESGESAMARYGVQAVHDAASDRFGHVPFTAEAIAALGTTVARWHLALARRPVKVIAVDGDHTLWSGVVGEDGIEGVRVEGGHRRLQEALVEQSQRGRLLCLLSKNEEDDLRALYGQRRDMIAKWEHFTAHRIDWNPKADNLRSVATELELGLDSFVFLDDNPVECAEMRARRPEVTTVRVPSASQDLSTFVDHLWLLDQPRVTDEDRKRVQIYQESSARAAERATTSSLEEFLDRLQLEVDIAAVAPGEVARMAQLTQRTNQFNVSLFRCEEAAISVSVADAACWHRLVRVRDRFGDYGIVGQLRAAPRANALAADLFMLSCRALGRGVEHRMLRALGQQALSLGLSTVEIRYVAGERNGPARRFLEATMVARDDGAQRWFSLSAHDAAALAFNPAAAPAEEVARHEDAAPPTGPLSQSKRDLGELHEHVACTLTTGAAIVRAMASRTRARPDLATGYVAPAAGLERDLADIWQETLRVEGVGARDRFQDLGGRSIHLVQVHRLMRERLGLDVDITVMFQHATVSTLAAHLSSASGDPGIDARNRAQNMRAARARAAARFGATS